MFLLRKASPASVASFGRGSTSSSSSGAQLRALATGPNAESEQTLQNPPSRARVVICGGGIMGASVAYHLALAGWAEHTVLLEQSRIGSSSTWHSSGLVGAFKPSYAQVRLAQQSIQLLDDLTQRGLPTGWKQCGSLNLARTRDRMTVFRRMKSQSVGWGIECELLSPAQCAERAPLIDTSDIIGGLWIPNDGVGDTHALCSTLIAEARAMGVRVIEDCPVSRVVQQGGRVAHVEARHGAVSTACQFFVNCGGFWARHIGQLSVPAVKVPLHAVEHYYLHTGPVPGLAGSRMPVIRDMDGGIYLRERDGCLLAGGFGAEAKAAFADGSEVHPADRRLSADWDDFHVLFDELLRRVPSLEHIALDRLCNGAEAFSPDCKWILGESPEIQNYLVAAGMKTVGISASGGVGRAIADHITLGGSPLDLYDLDVSRFLSLHNNRKYLRERAAEAPGMHYALPFPFHEFRTGRQLRMSPIYPALRAEGAMFGETMGYERPNYFDRELGAEERQPRRRPDARSSTNQTFGKPDWFDIVADEYAACRERIGLADYSSFTKIDLWSADEREVVAFLQYMCSNDMDVPVGSIVHTGMQNERGGYENDCSMARLAPNHYMMIAPTIQQTRCKTWIERHLPRAKGRVMLSDVTSMYTAICILGPFSRRLLGELTDADVRPQSFPFFTFKEIDVGQANGVRAMNLTHTGELGYVLYVPNEFALHVYQMLWEAGKRYGMQHAGHYATRTLRIEKFYAYWGQDLDTFTTPLECGRSWRVKFDKAENFIGRDALLRQRDEGVRRMYVQLLLNDHDPDIDMWSWGGEPIYRNGVYCGQTTTTGYGYTFKKQICLGFVRNGNPEAGEQLQRVTNEFILNGDYEVEIAGIRYPAKVNLHSPLLPSKYPDNERDSYQATRDKPEAPPSVVTRKVHLNR